MRLHDIVILDVRMEYIVLLRTYLGMYVVRVLRATSTPALLRTPGRKEGWTKKKALADVVPSRLDAG